jgi:hypothetical protein
LGVDLTNLGPIVEKSTQDAEALATAYEDIARQARMTDDLKAFEDAQKSLNDEIERGLLIIGQSPGSPITSGGPGSLNQRGNVAFTGPGAGTVLPTYNPNLFQSTGGLGFGGGTVVNNNFSGMLMSTNPAAMSEVNDFVKNATFQGIRSSRKFSP